MLLEYNKKIDYLISKLSYSGYTGSIDELEWRSVYNGILEPQNIEQVFMLKIKDCFTLMKSGLYDLTLSFIDLLYKKLNGDDVIVEASKIQTLLTKVNEFTELKAAKTFAYILKEKPFELSNQEMAILLHTFIRLKDDELPIVFYPIDIESFKTDLDSGKDESLIVERIAMMSIKTLFVNTKHKLITKAEMIDKILLLKSNLATGFGVKSVGMYGSFARGEETEYSDLDLFIQVNEENKNDLTNKCQIFKFLRKQLGIRVDGTVNDSSFEALEVDMQRVIVTIF